VILADQLFKPRQIPGWWLRFTEANPVVPNIIAVAGLIWICISLAKITSSSEKHGRGQIIESIGVVAGSQPLVEKANGLRNVYHDLFPEEVRNLLAGIYGNLPLYLVVPFLLLLEFLFPCNPSQPLMGKGFLQDVIWYIVDIPLTLLILFPVLGFFRNLFSHYMGFLIFDSASTWPPSAQILAALLLAEFLIWFNHFARHKIGTLWLFHAVHHSQKELNIFTDDRAHIVDLFFGQLFAFIPFFIFHVSSLYAVAIIAIYKPIHNRFIHANLKLNLGWFGWIFTSPQFHRVHHSIEPEHADKNFGVYFSIYDYLFRTACLSRNVYPETGIADHHFPSEEKVRVSQLPHNWIMQTIYPFTQAFQKLLALVRLNHFRLRERIRNEERNSERTTIVQQEEPLSL
jgi:sterol desaturase/sphingolipid hydroxylase (fatty acid hydroxylase superfamily)